MNDLIDDDANQYNLINRLKNQLECEHSDMLYCKILSKKVLMCLDTGTEHPSNEKIMNVQFYMVTGVRTYVNSGEKEDYVGFDRVADAIFSSDGEPLSINTTAHWVHHDVRQEVTRCVMKAIEDKFGFAVFKAHCEADKS